MTFMDSIFPREFILSHGRLSERLTMLIFILHTDYSFILSKTNTAYIRPKRAVTRQYLSALITYRQCFN